MTDDRCVHGMVRDWCGECGPTAQRRRAEERERADRQRHDHERHARLTTTGRDAPLTEEECWVLAWAYREEFADRIPDEYSRPILDLADRMTRKPGSVHCWLWHIQHAIRGGGLSDGNRLLREIAELVWKEPVYA